jgi:DNA-binding CsgD family transcriptional regulator
MPLILTFEGFADHRIAQGLLARFDRLRPHLARAAVFSAQLGLERVRAAMAALQMVGVAAAMLDGQGRLQGANPSFEQLLGRGLWDGRDRFMLGDANGDAYFREALAKVLQGGSGRSMAVQIHDDDRSAVLHLIPIRGSARDVFVGSSMIMVLSEGGDARGQVDPTLLRSLFDLTAAEARVARMMLQGRTVGEIAGLCGIGHETVRSQLKAAMHKTGARRQSEFVLLLKGLALPQT